MLDKAIGSLTLLMSELTPQTLPAGAQAHKR
jgi:hypothetical protein